MAGPLTVTERLPLSREKKQKNVDSKDEEKTEERQEKKKKEKEEKSSDQRSVVIGQTVVCKSQINVIGAVLDIPSKAAG
uniref:Uncharacterized protein n=1 Tax=Vespula pensylvanica TaxID=30213 RepID=A0A834PAW1_VESPE|nr:hypothetical protein H0235_002931 [Vespula pensylvanica]